MSASPLRKTKRGHSTGPKTASGKKRSSENALRHGLAIPVGSAPPYDAAIDQLARILAGGNDNEMRVRFARPVAEAQIDILRIREAGNRRLAEALELENGALVPDPRFDRYEQRARSRRKLAMRAFVMNMILGETFRLGVSLMTKRRKSLLRRKLPEGQLDEMRDLVARSGKTPRFSDDLVEELIEQISERALGGELEPIRTILEIDAFEKAVGMRQQSSPAETMNSASGSARGKWPEGMEVPIVQLPIRDDDFCKPCSV